MKKILIFLTIFNFNLINSNDLSMSVCAQKNKKNQLCLAIIGNATDDFLKSIETLKKNISFCGQIEPEILTFEKLNKKKDIENLSEKYSLLIAFNQNNRSIEWRIYNTQNASMIKGKKFKYHESNPRTLGHILADELMPNLTGGQSSFATKISYCKESGKNRSICVADFDGSNEQILFSCDDKIIAPRWHSTEPLLLYSKRSKVNIGLMSLNMNGKEEKAINFIGLSMLPAFSEDGKEVVLCMSRDGSCQLYLYSYNEEYKKMGYKKLTNNCGNNLSPCVLCDGSIIYSSDFEKSNPSIYLLDRKKNVSNLLIDGKFCMSPVFCKEKNIIAYTEMIDDYSQIFTFDLNKKTKKQITFDGSFKEEPSFSPCGNFLIYSLLASNKKRIAHYNMLTKSQKIITSSNDSCSFPCWSPKYAKYPVVKLS